MREQYPFFRDRDEQTQAIIGEEAVNADLDGEYQKPYAVLTQKRLYCKNEKGNFITDAATLKSAGKGLLPGQNWFLWAVATCAGLALALLCLWYWGMGGQSNTQNAYDEAQQYIEQYTALARSIPEYKQKIETYENAQKAIEADQKLWQEKGYDQISGEMSSLRTQIESTQARRDECRSKANNNESMLEHCRQRLSGLERSLDAARSIVARYAAGIEYKPASPFGLSLSEAQKIVEDHDSLTKRAAELEEENRQLEEELTALGSQLRELQKKQTSNKAQAAAMEEIEGRIQSNREIMANIDHIYYKNEIKKHEAGQSDYLTAQDTQEKINQFQFSFTALAICVAAVLLLAVLKRVKAAATATWAFALAGFWCASLSGNIAVPPSLSTALRVLPVLAIPLSVLALWWNRKKTVFQVVHNTGAFFFTPSVYPAEELKQFSAQVRRMREGGADDE